MLLLLDVVHCVRCKSIMLSDMQWIYNTKGLWFTIEKKKRERNSSNSKNERLNDWMNEWMDASSKWILHFSLLPQLNIFDIRSIQQLDLFARESKISSAFKLLLFCIWKIGFFTVVLWRWGEFYFISFIYLCFKWPPTERMLWSLLHSNSNALK